MVQTDGFLLIEDSLWTHLLLVLIGIGIFLPVALLCSRESTLSTIIAFPP